MNTNIFSKHEVHCTVDSDSQKAMALFRSQCAAGGIKVIDVDNGATKVSRHVMTSTVCHSRKAAFSLIEELNELAKQTGIQLIREKIEVPPSWNMDSVSGQNYFELHVNIRALDLANVNFDRTKWFVSQNAGKAVIDGVPLWMLTARGYNTDIAHFRDGCQESMKKFKLLIDDGEPAFIEKCIYDNNVGLDEHWMKPGV